MMDDSSKNDLNKRIINNEDLGISEAQKQEAIKKEDHYRKLYYSIYDLNSTRNFNELANDLITGYDKMIDIYKNDSSKDQKDINFIIKFAFRDFFLLIFINMKNLFDNNEFLKDLHRKVYMSDNYVTIEDFDQLVNYCREYIKHESK